MIWKLEFPVHVQKRRAFFLLWVIKHRTGFVFFCVRRTINQMTPAESGVYTKSIWLIWTTWPLVKACFGQRHVLPASLVENISKSYNGNFQSTCTHFFQCSDWASSELKHHRKGDKVQLIKLLIPFTSVECCWTFVFIAHWLNHFS